MFMYNKYVRFIDKQYDKIRKKVKNDCKIS